jgi:Flp pilus assembly protein TadG
VPTVRALTNRLRTLRRDESGATAIFTGMLLVVALGFVGLGVDMGVGYGARRAAQGAADSAAFSAAVGKMAGAPNVVDQARAVAASYGLVNGVDGVTVTVNTPVVVNQKSNDQAVEVIIARPGRRFFSSFFATGATTIKARAVAVAGQSGNGCVIAFNAQVNWAVLENGAADVNLQSCSMYVNSTDPNGLYFNGSGKLHADKLFLAGNYGTNGNVTVDVKPENIFRGQPPIADPYKDVGIPNYQGCDYNAYSSAASGTVNIAHPGPPTTPVVFCNGLTLNGSATVNFAPGIYVVDRGTFLINGSGTVNAPGVTFVLTSSSGSSYANLTMNGTATLNATAMTSGPTAGLLFMQDRKAPTTGLNTTNLINGTAAATLQGALYFPKQKVTYNGTATTSPGRCTQLMADTISFNGTPNFQANCVGTGTRGIGGSPTTLVE